MDINTVFVLVMFATFILCLFSGYPMVFVLGGVAVLFAFAGEIANTYFDIWLDADLSFLKLAVRRIFSTVSSYSLIPLPLFIFMGLMLDRSDIARELLDAMQEALVRLPGGLAISVTAIGVVLAASTGIIGASVVLLASLALPSMLEARYSKSLATGVVAASGTLGILIPPSIMLIVMADQLALSVGDLFMAALLPGLVLAALYFVFVIAFAFIFPSHAPRGGAPASGRDRIAAVLRILKALMPPVLLIFSVLGSIFFGIASPTEAAGVGAAGATLLAWIKRRLDFETLRDVCYSTAKTTAFILGALVGATTFAVVLRGLGGDEVIDQTILSLPFGPEGTVLAILGIVFLLGFVLDWIEIAMIVLPLVASSVAALGFDLVWFAILVAVCMQTSFLTPPVGFALFFVKSASPPSVSMIDVYKGVVPFVLLQLVGLALVFAFPELALWLPSIVYQ
ncbi:TRAP transporter large permease subunit [Lutimaribacter marinistellae]|uniref:TRAP transporter large permease protein n=1 Tax=Lutimaribacter marinistellae TaxID=1820329 RepID=A0ABV7TC53_9RHOB